MSLLSTLIKCLKVVSFQQFLTVHPSRHQEKDSWKCFRNGVATAFELITSKNRTFRRFRLSHDLWHTIVEVLNQKAVKFALIRVKCSVDFVELSITRSQLYVHLDLHWNLNSDFLIIIILECRAVMMTINCIFMRKFSTKIYR